MIRLNCNTDIREPGKILMFKITLVAVRFIIATSKLIIGSVDWNPFSVMA
jgi:hypothetical protein